MLQHLRWMNLACMFQVLVRPAFSAHLWYCCRSRTLVHLICFLKKLRSCLGQGPCYRSQYSITSVSLSMMVTAFWSFLVLGRKSLHLERLLLAFLVRTFGPRGIWASCARKQVALSNSCLVLVISFYLRLRDLFGFRCQRPILKQLSM